MTYTQISALAVILAIIIDLFVLRTQLVKRKSFWNAYAIMVFFQLLTNWWLTSREILTYSPDVILGIRVAAAPVEDLLFGYSMILCTLSLWMYWGRRGIQRD